MGIYRLRLLPTLVRVVTILTAQPSKARFLNNSAVGLGVSSEDPVWREALESWERSQQTAVQEAAAFYQRAELMMENMRNKNMEMAGKLEKNEEFMGRKLKTFEERVAQQLRNTTANFREIAENQRNLKAAGQVRSMFLNSKSVSSVLKYSETLGTEQEKNSIYSGLVSVMMWQSGYSWTIHEACQIYKIPQLHPLKSRIPQNIKIIFSEERKAIETRPWARRLTSDGGFKTTRNYDSSGHKHFKFFPTDDCNYFVVKNMEVNNSFCNSVHPNRGWNVIMSDISCHWTIILQISGYYKFIHRVNNKALGADDAGGTFFRNINGDASQDWELKQ